LKFFRLSHGLGSQAPAFHHNITALTPDQFICDLHHQETFLSQYCGVALSASFHQHTKCIYSRTIDAV